VFYYLANNELEVYYQTTFLILSCIFHLYVTKRSQHQGKYNAQKVSSLQEGDKKGRRVLCEIL